MIDIFELQRLIDANPKHSNLDTVVMSVDNHRNLNRYFTDQKYKGYHMLALSILEDDKMWLGKKPDKYDE